MIFFDNEVGIPCVVRRGGFSERLQRESCHKVEGLAGGDVTPCGEGESFPSDGKLGLYADMSQTKSTPDVAAHEVRLQAALHFILCLHGAEDAEHKDSQYKCCSHVCKDNFFLL